jgi:MYXO-CTERM domain-containing protein
MKSLALRSSVPVLLLTSAALADLPDLDVWITASGGSLITGGWDHESGVIVNPFQRVFAGGIGEDPEIPFSGSEPGLGSDLLGMTLHMTLLPGLSRWNGAGFSTTDTVLTTAYGPMEASSATGGSLNFLVFPHFHLHPDETLSGAGGSDPASGIYLASFTFSVSGLQSSDPVYFLLNLGMSDEDHEAAFNWTNENLVPGSGAMALLGLASLGARRRRRDRR